LLPPPAFARTRIEISLHPRQTASRPAACPGGEDALFATSFTLAIGFGGLRVMAIFGAWYDFFFGTEFLIICAVLLVILIGVFIFLRRKGSQEEDE
jgi:hypothetical protein